MDLEKEYKEYVEDDPVFRTLTNRIAGFAIATHFYELGKTEGIKGNLEEIPSNVDLEKTVEL